MKLKEVIGCILIGLILAFGGMALVERAARTSINGCNCEQCENARIENEIYGGKTFAERMADIQ